MTYSPVFLSLAMTVCSSALSLSFLYRFAEWVDLVDRPNQRKRHLGRVPLIGGLSAFFGFFVGTAIGGHLQPFTSTLIGTTAALVLVGALDDRFDLSVRIRLLVQTAAVLTMVGCTGVYIHTLGHMFGQELELGWLGIPLTVIAVIGLLNAFNMMDGIDGLAGTLALVSIGTIVVLQGQWRGNDDTVLLLLAAGLVPYLLMNLGLIGRKIFLGDAGSMAIGYILAWVLIHLSQSGPSRGGGFAVSTVDVLWCVALPVLDTLAVTINRMREGKSPFKPDRGHIHHLMLNAGLGPRSALAALIGLAIVFAFIGTRTRMIAQGSNLLAFGALAIVYIVTVTRIRRRQQARQPNADATPSAMSVRMVWRRSSS